MLRTKIANFIFSVLFGIGSLMKIPWGLGIEHVAILDVILYYKYQSQNSVHFVG